MFLKKLMARKDNQAEEYVPADEVVEEAPVQPKQLFKKNPVEQEAQTIVVTENQLILEFLKTISAKLDEVLTIAKQ